ncbi:hypothetical protein P171DRAFT_42727 [Karstenula rhodostoma CBS 690.94]|uniref:Uncharacterized protein n=1 Tax=Karstenula rhodostoma CBS 690.94 TaxID=1392251 RepID=A0A9P4UAY5_9PLEO|nr:hypothetical protein P171DRAFT_42727 [Karstenula rhodostoma CBS 690.94]
MRQCMNKTSSHQAKDHPPSTMHHPSDQRPRTKPTTNTAHSASEAGLGTRPRAQPCPDVQLSTCR